MIRRLATFLLVPQLVHCTEGSTPGNETYTEPVALIHEIEALCDSGQYVIAQRKYEFLLDEPDRSDSTNWCLDCVGVRLDRYFGRLKSLRTRAEHCFRSKKFHPAPVEYAEFNYYLAMTNSFQRERRYCEACMYLDSAVTYLKAKGLPLGYAGAQTYLDSMLTQIRWSSKDVATFDFSELKRIFCAAP